MDGCWTSLSVIVIVIILIGWATVVEDAMQGHRKGRGCLQESYGIGSENDERRSAFRERGTFGIGSGSKHISQRVDEVVTTSKMMGFCGRSICAWHDREERESAEVGKAFGEIIGIEERKVRSAVM